MNTTGRKRPRPAAATTTTTHTSTSSSSPTPVLRRAFPLDRGCALFARYVDRSEPIILEGQIDAWPAMRRWGGDDDGVNGDDDEDKDARTAGGRAGGPGVDGPCGSAYFATVECGAVDVSCAPSAGAERGVWYGDDVRRQQVRVPWRHFVNLMAAKERGERHFIDDLGHDFYLCQCPIVSNDGGGDGVGDVDTPPPPLEALAPDVTPLPAVLGVSRMGSSVETSSQQQHRTDGSSNQQEARQVRQVNLWASVGSPTRSSVHYDARHNLLCVVRGSKTVRLSPPKATPFMDAFPVWSHSANHSRRKVSPRPQQEGEAKEGEEKEETAKEKASTAENTAAESSVASTNMDTESVDTHGMELCATLLAGDCLFIPEGWWHQVDSAKGTLAVNIWFDGFRAQMLPRQRPAPLLSSPARCDDAGGDDVGIHSNAGGVGDPGVETFYLRALLEDMVEREVRSRFLEARKRSKDMSMATQHDDGASSSSRSSSSSDSGSGWLHSAETSFVASVMAGRFCDGADMLVGLSPQEMRTCLPHIVSAHPCAWQTFLFRMDPRSAALMLRCWDELEEGAGEGGGSEAGEASGTSSKEEGGSVVERLFDVFNEIEKVRPFALPCSFFEHSFPLSSFLFLRPFPPPHSFFLHSFIRSFNSPSF